MKAASKRQRHPGISLLANLLQKDVRTLRRWITQRPQLRRVLRAKRQGKQWRIGYPKANGEFDAWITEVRNAVSTFARTPECMGKGTSRLVKETLKFSGFGGEETECKQRERDIEILRHALLLKYASRKLPTQEADGEEHAVDNPPSLAERESEAANCCLTARFIAARFKCSVEQALNHWADFCREKREENRRFNAPKEAWLRAHGLYERAQQLLPDTKRPGNLIAFIGAVRADGTPRIKLYRFAPSWKSNRDASWRKMFFDTDIIQLLRVETDEEIAAEVSQVEKLWPETRHWRKAKEQLERDWQIKTLSNAAFELVRDAKPIITGATLAPLLFRNQQTQDVWQSHQEHLELKRRGVDVFCDEKTFCKNAKRGISLREFRQRYTKRDIANAKAVALQADASDFNLGSKMDENQATVENEVLENMASLDSKLKRQQDERPKQKIDLTWVNQQLQALAADDLKIKKWLAGLTAEEQKIAEQALSDPFLDRL